MDRLTCRIDAGVVVAASDMRDAMKRLADYEDTGMSPEEIQYLVNFRKELERVKAMPDNAMATVEIPVGWKATGPAWWIFESMITGSDIRTEDDVNDLLFWVNGGVLCTEDGEECGVVHVDPEAKTIEAKMYGGNFYGQTGGEGNRHFE